MDIERSRFEICSNRNQLVLASQNVLPITSVKTDPNTVKKKLFVKQKQRFDVQIYVVSKAIKLKRQSMVFGIQYFVGGKNKKHFRAGWWHRT